MPIPKPRKGETQQEYIQRGMSNDVMEKEFPDQKQRLAVLYSTWREHKGERQPDKHGLIEDFEEEQKQRQSVYMPIISGGMLAGIIGMYPGQQMSPLFYVTGVRPIISSLLLSRLIPGLAPR